jgi:serine/threonine protein kinase
MSVDDEKSLKEELKIYKTINHPFTVKFIEEFIHHDKKDKWGSPSHCIVTEYAAGGNLL